MTKHMGLALDLSFSHMEGRWRLPGSWVGRQFPDLSMYREIASIAERGRMDMIFFGDGTGIPSAWENSRDAAIRWGAGWPRQDMSPFIAALSQVTTNIGFGLTYSSTYMHPFYVARLLNSLDHVTGGRMAFNVVTSSRPADAANYGFGQLMDHDERYVRMEEFMDVCQALWRSVDEDAMLWDRATGHVADPGKIRAIDHHGKYFDVAGPLNSVPSPQGAPVILQAGGSPRGIAASARFADVIFAGAHDKASMSKHRSALDAALVLAGRDPSDVGIFWDIQLVVAETPEDAIARKNQLFGLLPIEAVGAHVSANAGMDFSTLPPKFVLGELHERIMASNASPKGIVGALIDEHGADYEMSRDDFFEYAWRQASGYDHTVAGSYTEVADELEAMFEASGERGGFMVAHPQATPRDLVDVVGLLIPELRRRGRFRTEYEGSTLRDTLGIGPFDRTPRATPSLVG
ncbi:MAG: NtaA/DmoA family FMN-dependent monooxygenase [Actinobacteria bacterium]|nr:NtaA/DmoA family FMN-dependent monooxygenase [Actinomycetota bacterium]